MALLLASLAVSLTACDEAPVPPDPEPEVPWSLLTGQIAYARVPLLPGGERRLVIVDAASRTVTTVARESDFAPRHTGFCHLAWAPDGSRLAFDASRLAPLWKGIMSVGPDGRNPTALFPSTPGVDAGTSFMASPAWARDGRLAYTLTRDNNFWTSASEVWIDGQPFYDAGGQGWDLVQTPPAWSPDGRHLVVAAQPQRFRTQLLRIALADGTVTQLFEVLTPSVAGGSLHSPVFSPDGTQIAFARGSASREIWVMNADGSAARHLTQGAHPAWSSDGSMILYEDRLAVLRLISLGDGTTHRLVGGAEGSGSCPAWLS